MLGPKLFLYTNVGVAVGSGLVGLRYTHRRNINTTSGLSSVTPVPSGLSGCPMVDTVGLIRGEVRIVGVLTEQSNGQARGEDVAHVGAGMALLR